MNRITKRNKDGVSVRTFSQVNIDGLSTHSKLALDKFIFENSISLVALQETKLNKDQLDGLDKFTNMASFFQPKLESTYGVGLIISPQLLPQRMTELEEANCDILWCMIKVNNLSVLTASAYTPPNNVQKLKKILDNIDRAFNYGIKNKVKDILVFGDFNGRNITWGDTVNNPHGRKVMDFIDKSNFMLCTPADKTFISPNNGGSVIDLLLGSGSITNTISENWTDRTVQLFTGAPIRGHFPVLYTVGNCQALTDLKQYDDYSNTDWSSWKKTLELGLSSWNLSLIHSIPPSSELLGQLVSTFNSALQDANKMIPKKIISLHSKPFWTDSLTICSQELKELNIAIRCRYTPLNKKLFDDKKEEFKSLLLHEKNNWIREKLTNINISDSKTFWKRYKALFHDRQTNFIGNLSKNGRLFTSDSDKDKILFDEYFSGNHQNSHDFDKDFEVQIKSIYSSLQDSGMLGKPSLANKAKEAVNIKHANITGQNISDPLNDPVTLSELDAVIDLRKSEGKATDCYNVNPIMLKHLGTNAKTILVTIFNSCLMTGSWCWNKQDICFIKKPGKACYLDPAAYRPISLSSNVGKLLEKVLERRIRQHCKFYEILDSPQEGFCPNRSTTRYLFKLLSTLGEAKKKKLISMVLLIDFQKAFDSVWIPGLVVKLYNYGIKGRILQLLNSFLSNRQVQLKINGKVGEFHKICSQIGLPQGSVLSPLLFIIYISEMLENFHNTYSNSSTSSSTLTKCYKYADDGTVSVTGSDVESCHAQLQNICNRLFEWCRKWRLVVNCDPDKTEVLIINGCKFSDVSSLTPVKIGNVSLQYVKKSKVLGITIDKDLSFGPHAKDMLKRCWYQWYKVSKGTTRQYGLSTASLTLLFKTLVLTKLMYAAPAWLNNQLELFNDLWSRVLLKLVGSEYHTDKALSEALLNLPPLEIQLEVLTTKFLLKCLYSDDEMIATLLSINDDPRHPLFIKSQQLKRYIIWKEQGCSTQRRHTTHGIDLINFLDRELCYYTKEDICSSTVTSYGGIR